MFTVPPQAANVWVEFEEGDPDRPVWVGGFWDEGEPPPPASPDHKVLRTTSSTIILDDSGGVTIDSPSIQIDGVASFSRSGVVTVPSGASSVTVRGVEGFAFKWISYPVATTLFVLPTVILLPTWILYRRRVSSDPDEPANRFGRLSLWATFPIIVFDLARIPTHYAFGNVFWGRGSTSAAR